MWKMILATMIGYMLGQAVFALLIAFVAAIKKTAEKE